MFTWGYGLLTHGHVFGGPEAVLDLWHVERGLAGVLRNPTQLLGILV